MYEYDTVLKNIPLKALHSGVDLQSVIEYSTGANLCSEKYVGFFYNFPAFSFLNDFVYSFCFIKHGFEILPLNWILTLGAAFGLGYISFYIYKLVNLILYKEHRPNNPLEN